MDRNEAIEWLKTIKEKYIHGGDDFYDYQRRTAIDYAVEFLNANAVEVVHGRWALVEYQSSPFGVDQEYQCTICGTPTDYENITRYCPNCGAKMDGDGNG